MGMIRDPHVLFFYWEVTEEERRALWQRIGYDWSTGALVLRLVDVHAEGSPCHDAVVGEWIGSWYVPVTPNRLYDSSLGFRRHDGEYEELLRGPRLRTPRDVPADEAPSFFERKEGRWVETLPPWASPTETPLWSTGATRPPIYPTVDRLRSMLVPYFPYASLETKFR